MPGGNHAKRRCWPQNVCFTAMAVLAAATAAEPPAVTSLSNATVHLAVPQKHYVILRCGALEAVVVDNQDVDDAVLPGHRA